MRILYPPALCGGLLGTAAAWFAVRAIPFIQAIEIPRSAEIALNGYVLAAAVSGSVLCGILCGLVPAYMVARMNLKPSLQSDSASIRGRGAAIRNTLITVQVALAIVLLSGAGLMANSLIRLLNIHTGFNPRNILIVNATLPQSVNVEPLDASLKSRYSLQEHLAEELRTIPGIDGVCPVSVPPLLAMHSPYNLKSEEGRECEAEGRHVEKGYLSVTGIPLLAGRDFQPGDDDRKPVPVLLNRIAARMLFGDENPIGRIIESLYYPDCRFMESIGLVEDARQLGLREPPGAQIYIPASYGSIHFLLVSTKSGAGNLDEPIVKTIQKLTGGLPVGITSMNERLSEEVAQPRFYFLFLGIFAAAGLILAAVGIYGAMAYSVAQRTREIGIRMALGAGRGGVWWMMLRTGLVINAADSLLGIAGAAVATKFLSSLLYEVQPGDPLTLGAVVILLSVVVLLACNAAARKALKIDPFIALKVE